MTPHQLGERLRTARLTRGLTQALVAGKAGIAREHLLRIEAGAVDPSVGTVARIAQALEVPLLTLFSSGRVRMAPNSRQIDMALMARFQQAYQARQAYVDVKAGDLHRDLANPSKPGMNRAPLVCRVMRKHKTAQDPVLSQPSKGDGLTFTVRYHLPRPRRS